MSTADSMTPAPWAAAVTVSWAVAGDPEAPESFTGWPPCTGPTTSSQLQDRPGRASETAEAAVVAGAAGPAAGADGVAADGVTGFGGVLCCSRTKPIAPAAMATVTRPISTIATTDDPPLAGAAGRGSGCTLGGVVIACGGRVVATGAAATGAVRVAGGRVVVGGVEVSRGNAVPGGIVGGRSCASSIASTSSIERAR